ncbi:hypothetical protein EI94DRAFT_1798823 [Lactarius quietus]|nr:hypothetical protein EI94DRAFT_1798823 [Lactarius quietus]
MLSYGSVAVALVQRQVMVVQASRPHDECERYLDVYTFTPSSERMFLVSDAPCARIDSNDLLTVFDTTTPSPFPTTSSSSLRRRSMSSASCPLARTGVLTPFGLRGRASSVEELLATQPNLHSPILPSCTHALDIVPPDFDCVSFPRLLYH